MKKLEKVVSKFKRDMPDAHAALVAQGWQFSITAKQHLKLIAPDGRVIVCSMIHGGNPQSAATNFRRDLKKAGVL